MQKTVLIVDDDPRYIDLVTDILTNNNLKVVAASDGITALSKLDSHEVHVIVSDIEMPTMDGLALHSRIKNDDRFKSIPFVFLSGNEDPGTFEYLKKHPAVTLIQKSNQVHHLLATVTSLL